MIVDDMTIRKSEYAIDPFFINRWSPRAFSAEPINDTDLLAIIEAAHWAPSCFNEQPWFFHIAKTLDARQLFLNFLTESNRIWAKNAPVLIALASEKLFSKNAKQNRWHSFDCGTAWGFLAMEAKRRGYITHAMGGFNQQLASQTLKLSQNQQVETVIALGRHGDPSILPEDLQEREVPSLRKPLPEIMNIL